MPAGEVTVRLNLNKDGYSAGMTAARKEAAQFAQTMDKVGHGTVSSMQASSAAIRVLEGGMTGNIRAAERFIGMLPGVGTALKAAFPVVGGIALAGVFVKIGEEVANAIRKIEQMPTAIENGFRTLNMSAQTANDSLRVTNDRLENEIAKLEGKPQNNLMLAIDEARLAADKFAEALDRDNQKVKDLLSQNSIGAAMALATNRESTNTVAGTSKSFNQQISDLGARYSLAVGGHTAEAGGTPEELLKQINDKRAAGIAKMNEFIREAQAKQAAPSNMNSAPLLQGLNISGPDQAAVVAMATGERDTLIKQGDSQQQGSRNATDEARLAKDKASKDALEAGKRAQEAIIAQWRKDLDEARITFDNILVQEGQFWVQRMESARKGSLSYIAALDEANKDIGRMHAENLRAQREFDETAKVKPDSMDLSRGDTGTMKEQGRDSVDFLKNLNQGISAAHSSASAYAEMSLQIEVMTGRMSTLAAAQALAALHAHDYAEAQNAVSEALVAASALPDSLSKQATIAGLNNQSAQMAAQRQVQTAQDQQGVQSQQLGPAMQQTLGIIANEWTNMTKSIIEVTTRAMDSFNDDITKAATGQGKKGDFGQTFLQAGQGLFKTALQGLEGNVLKGLGLGGTKKADGSKDNPFYTIPVGQQGQGPGPGLAGAASGFFRPFMGGQPQSQGGGGGGIGGFFKTLMGGLFKSSGNLGSDVDGMPLGFQGGFAGGGDVLANHPAMVGEAGPELFLPRTSGRIVPNHQLGGESHVYHIDARGSNDPMAVHAAVARGLPHAVAASVQANHQARMRSPGGR